MSRYLLMIVAAAGSATAQPVPRYESLKMDASAVRRFVVMPEHAHVRWVTIDGCGTVADLVPLRGLPAGIEVQLGTSACLTVERLDGLERAATVRSFALVRDVSALANTTLRRLGLHNGPLPMADLLKHAPASLEELSVNLRKQSRADVQRLLGSKLVAQLTELDLSLDHVPVLPSLPSLHRLSVSLVDMPRADLGFVRAAANLRHLQVGGVEHADLAPILALRELETLDVAGLCHVDARSLARLPKLTRVKLSMLVDPAHEPSRPGLDVRRSNPYALCSSPKP